MGSWRDPSDAQIRIVQHREYGGPRVDGQAALFSRLSAVPERDRKFAAGVMSSLAVAAEPSPKSTRTGGLRDLERRCELSVSTASPSEHCR